MQTELTTFAGRPRGVNPKEIAVGAFIKNCSRFLKTSQKFQLPKWIDHVKTAPGNELSPYDPDWMYIRSASILRNLFIQPDVGILGLRKKYSKKVRRGVRPGRRGIAGGSIIRHCVHQMERMGLVTRHQNRTGRRLSTEGYKLVHRISKEASASDEQ